MRNSAYTKPQIWNFHATEFLYIFNQSQENSFAVL